MDTNSYLRIVSILILVLAGIRWSVALVPKQIKDMTRFVNGYRLFKKKLNWLSGSLFSLIVISTSIDMAHLYGWFDLTGLLAVLRSLTVMNLVEMLIHVYSYECPAGKDDMGFSQPKEE